MLKFLKCAFPSQLCVLLAVACLISFELSAQSKSGSGKQHHKLAPGLEQIQQQKTTSVRVQVKDKKAFIKWLRDNRVDAIATPVPGNSELVTVAGVDAAKLEKLLQNPYTQFIDKPLRKAQVELELKDADFTVNKVYAVQGKFPGLTGTGYTISVKEEAFDPTDIDLRGRVLEPEKNGGNYSIHATTMATLIAGGGNSGPNGKGVAPAAKVTYSSFADLLPDNSQTLISKGISVQNHSYGVGVENYYGVESVAYDKQVFENSQLLHVFSSGNSGDKIIETGNYANIPGFANLTGQFKTSKNTLSVGALDPNGKVGQLSSKGPAYDGRIKPELVAHGKGGTSEAAAVVSGIALLVQQAYAASHGGALPPAALVKAVLLNSADDTGRPAVDHESGFGNANALGAVRTIQEDRFLNAVVSNGQQNKFKITVPEGAGLLKVTLTWHEKEASPADQKALINELDLTLHQTASNQKWLPWVLSTYPHADSLKLPARRGTDRLNNVEQITVAMPQAGEYEITVSGFHIPQGSQEFSLAYEFGEKTEWLHPAAGTSLLADKVYTLNWQANSLATDARLEYKYNSDQNWRTIQQNINLQDRQFSWQTPDTAAILQLRLVSDQTEIKSEEFAVSRLLTLKVGFICEDQVMVHWSKMPNVQHYQLYRMGSNNLEPILTTTDTLAILDGRTGNLSKLFAVAPVFQNQQGVSSNTIAADQVGVGCYIRSFLPSALVQEQVAFQLELSSLYNLATVAIERQEAGKYKEVFELTPTQLSYDLQDAKPLAGKGSYRVKLTTKSGKVYYSNPEEVYFADSDYLLAYPNPVAAGEPLSIVLASESAHIQLFDRLCRLLWETTEIGMVKSIPTNNLPKGLYILRVQTQDSRFLSTRIIVY